MRRAEQHRLAALTLAALIMVQRCGQIAAKSVRTDFQHRGNIANDQASLESIKDAQASAGSLLLGNDDDEESEWPSSDDVVLLPLSKQRDPLTTLWEELVRDANQKRPRTKALSQWRKRSASSGASSSSVSGLSGASAGPENVSQLRQAIAMWETKLMRFAEKFSDNPQLLMHNPTWIRLMQVRDSLQQLLAKHHQLDMLDQTRM